MQHLKKKTYELEDILLYFLLEKVQINNKFYNSNLLKLQFLLSLPLSVASITLCHGPVISTTPHSVTTPTVCGHAEACPSTTYGKSKLARGPFTRATFWLGGRGNFTPFVFGRRVGSWRPTIRLKLAVCSRNCKKKT